MDRQVVSALASQGPCGLGVAELVKITRKICKPLTAAGGRFNYELVKVRYGRYPRKD